MIERLVPPFETMADAWGGHYRVKGKDTDADCIIGFSFGYRSVRKKVLPGLSNQDLANVALKHYPDLPKILQFEIADAYVEAGGDASNIIRITKFRGHSQKEDAAEMDDVAKHLDTREVAAQAQLIMKQRGWKSALLLAHPYHMPRVQAVCTRLGIDWVTTGDERGAVEFDPMSAQKWTRNLDQWRGYEPLALMYYRLKGWL